VVMPFIGSFLNRTGRPGDLFATFKFHVEIGNIIEAAFTDCSGLEMTTEVYEYAEGGENQFVHKFPGRTKVSDVTLKRGFTTSNELYAWYKNMEDCVRLGRKFDLRQVTITLYSNAEPGTLARWTLDRAFPIKWTGPAFKSDEAAMAVETLQLAHHGILVDAQTRLPSASSLLSKLRQSWF
jgi:phage tail-like protein